MLKHFAEVLYPGWFFSNHKHQAIAERKPELVTISEGAFAYRFYDQEITVIDGELLIGRCKNYSGFTYFGKAYTLEEVKQQFPQKNILISNMEDNGWDRVVQTSEGKWYPLEEGDTVIE